MTATFHAIISRPLLFARHLHDQQGATRLRRSASQKQKRKRRYGLPRTGCPSFFAPANTSCHNLCQSASCDPKVAVSPSSCFVVVKAKDGRIPQVATCPSLGLAEKPAAHPTDWPRSNRPNGCAAFLPSFSSPKFREESKNHEPRHVAALAEMPKRTPGLLSTPYRDLSWAALHFRHAIRFGPVNLLADAPACIGTRASRPPSSEYPLTH